jgi:hypothetical protein
MMRRSVRGAFVLVFVCMIAASTGCMRVKPWQRADLARPDMQFDTDPQRTALQSHIQFSKEASMPGTSAGGGGCGCN